MAAQKMTKEKVLFLIENAGIMNSTEIAMRCEVNHTTILWWRKRLAKNGIKVPKFRKGGIPPSKRIIMAIKAEYKKAMEDAVATNHGLRV